MKEVAALLIGHGSKLEEQRKMVEQIALSIKSKNIFADVFYAFMNVNRPSVQESMSEIVKKGYKKIVAIPIFLSDGIHTTEDIPKVLGLPKGVKKGFVDVDGKKVEVFYARTIGFDERIVEILIERGKEAIDIS
ncbi:MAG: sirohydrochlorin nickelochelatase [Archaeoglobales archaeon]|nr:sirohydrochlorin nickelochelatase [Archaeoglobales archaeon]